MWVADSGLDDDKCYTYKMADKSRDPAKDFNTLIAAGNTTPNRIWSDGTTMWVFRSGRCENIRLQFGEQAARAV